MSSFAEWGPAVSREQFDRQHTAAWASSEHSLSDTPLVAVAVNNTVKVLSAVEHKAVEAPVPERQEVVFGITCR